ncbi:MULTISPECIES: glycoside hydrolase family 20 protein [unclassified Streptomyces]|uniref:beta-N-acetylhexosaminidase n=1 Tax=unclassified Streptomyces TaxID=2593676 RepID=UPI000CD583CA|nr:MULTISPECIES: glycoside hydrolase family 20 protein [unclassified Streptomyces]
MARVLTGGVVAMMVVLVALGAVLLGGPERTAERSSSQTASGADAPEAEEPRAAPVGPDEAPSAVPAVRSWEPAEGDGWAVTPDTRVVAVLDGVLDDEAERLADELSVPVTEGDALLGDVLLEVDPDSPLGPEEYTLTSRDGTLTITGSHDAGVFYGTRTLVQSVRDAGGVAEGVVKDAPDRPQRGFMLDIVRKHFPADWIEERLHMMGDLKLNQLQLHFSDDQGFRIESEEFPEIVSEEHLTKDEVRRIVELAESLHITVIPEIDSPGHLGAVLDAYPELRLNNAAGEPVPGAIDISQPRAGELLDDLTREYAQLFPGPYWHLGGDEYGALYYQDPEGSFPALAEAREAIDSVATTQDLATAWLNDRADTARELDRLPQVWNDGMHAGGTVQPDAERQVTYWTGREIGARPPEEYLEGGWELINMSSEYLYYVLGEPVGFVYPTGERIYEEWTPDVLRGNEPVADELGGPDNVLGGRFAVWCDLADSQTTDEVADGIRLPLHATAQKLWNPDTPELEWEEFTALADRVEAGATA